jgi:hypothetical protein
VKDFDTFDGRRIGEIRLTFMKNPFELIPLAVAIGVAWMLLSSMTGLDGGLKNLFGRKESGATLEAKIAILEKRVAQLEEKISDQVQAR